MKSITKTVTQDFAHDKRSISYIIVKDTTYNDIRVQIFENGNFVNDVSCNNLNDEKKKSTKIYKINCLPFLLLKNSFSNLFFRPKNLKKQSYLTKKLLIL
jgi:hypothetical protein